MWHQKAKEKVAAYDKADWKVFDAANDILDLRLWAVSTAGATVWLSTLSAAPVVVCLLRTRGFKGWGITNAVSQALSRGLHVFRGHRCKRPAVPPSPLCKIQRILWFCGSV